MKGLRALTGLTVSTTCLLLLLLCASSASGLDIGTDVLVPAAGRGAGSADSLWITDLYVLNVDVTTAAVEVYWLERNQANPAPAGATFNVAPGETLILEDVISETFGLTSAGGAFRVVADREVAVNSRIYNLKGSVTFGQGFEGIPRVAAVAEGNATDVVGLRQDSGFRTNIVLMDASDSEQGSTVELSLRDRTGGEIAAQTFQLGRLEPRLFSVTSIAGSSFDYATLHAEVTSGAAIVAASKIDNDPATGDPTTLEAWLRPGVSATGDGTYQFAIYDDLLFAAGGNLVIEDDHVVSITGTYFNWDKLDGPDPACTLLFAWGGILSSPIPVADFSSGVAFDTPYPDGGEMTYTVQFVLVDNESFSGAISAFGASFSGIDTGCNGTFPDLVLEGGKTR